MVLRSSSHAFKIQRVESDDILPVSGVTWSTAYFTVGQGEQLVYPTPQGDITIDLPAEFCGAVDKRKSEFLAGRLCAFLALRSLGISGQVKRSGRAPIWPAGVCGSISHHEGRAIAVASVRHASLGVDYEAILKEEVVRDLEPAILTDSDRSRFDGSMSKAEYCTLVFCAKEAAYKAVSEWIDDIPDFSEAYVASLGLGYLNLAFRGLMIPVHYAINDAKCVTLATLF